VLDVFYEADREAVQRNVSLCLEQLGRTMFWEFRKVRKNGTVLWVRETAKAVLRAKNQPIVLIACEDITERKRAEAALQRSEASLAEAQQISHTGSWRWKVGTGEVSWSAEQFRILAFDPATTEPSYAAFMERIHAEDRPSIEQGLDRAVRERSRYQYEYRIVLPDGSVRYLHSVGHPDITESGDLEFVGTVMDITERRRAEEALRDTQAELARVARLTTMGELVASIAHEINQPLAAIATGGSACLRWLNRDKPDLDAARDAVALIVRDTHRAGDVIQALRALTKKSGPQLTKLDINGTIEEVLALTRSDLQRHGVVLRTDLSAEVRPVLGDRVQLQQVLLNLITNGVDAMSAVTGRPKVLVISSEPVEPDEVLVAVADSGTGLDPAMAERIFEPFFTTKPNGMGMGLSICRSIIDAHGGRLWVLPRVPSGAVFRFTVPIDSPDVAMGLHQAAP
jgi:signal transduction histidine kinase